MCFNSNTEETTVEATEGEVIEANIKDENSSPVWVCIRGKEDSKLMLTWWILAGEIGSMTPLPWGSCQTARGPHCRLDAAVIITQQRPTSPQWCILLEVAGQLYIWCAVVVSRLLWTGIGQGTTAPAKRRNRQIVLLSPWVFKPRCPKFKGDHLTWLHYPLPNDERPWSRLPEPCQPLLKTEISRLSFP